MAADVTVLRYLNDDPGFTVSNREHVAILKELGRIFSAQGATCQVLVLGAGKDNVGKIVSGKLKELELPGAISVTDVDFPQKNSTPIVNEDVPIYLDRLDTTRKFTTPKRNYDLILGRAIVCLCGTNKVGGPCGFPALVDDAPKFLRRVGKSLTPNGVAYLHGDRPGLGETAKTYWSKAKAICEGYGGKKPGDDAKDWFKVELVEGKDVGFCGIKVSRGKA